MTGAQFLAEAGDEVAEACSWPLSSIYC